MSHNEILSAFSRNAVGFKPQVLLNAFKMYTLHLWETIVLYFVTQYFEVNVELERGGNQSRVYYYCETAAGGRGNPTTGKNITLIKNHLYYSSLIPAI